MAAILRNKVVFLLLGAAKHGQRDALDLLKRRYCLGFFSADDVKEWPGPVGGIARRVSTREEEEEEEVVVTAAHA